MGDFLYAGEDSGHRTGFIFASREAAGLAWIARGFVLNNIRFSDEKPIDAASDRYEAERRDEESEPVRAQKRHRT
jgi:hypothetical protein